MITGKIILTLSIDSTNCSIPDVWEFVWQFSASQLEFYAVWLARTNDALHVAQ
jgi:hypothetical protein